VIEIDGGQHNLPKERVGDEARTGWLEAQGFRVLRFWNNQVLGDIDSVLERIIQELGK